MKLIDLFEQSRAPLYHGLKLEYACKALKDNKMLATSTQRFWPDGKRRLDNDPEYKGSYWMKGISLTRDKQYAATWAQVVFILDQDYLQQRYKIVPFNWSYSIPTSTSRKKEREEFLIVKATPDKYLRTHDEDGEEEPTPIFDLKRFTSPEGDVPKLDRYLLGVYLRQDAIDIYGEDHELVKQVKAHPKFIGLLSEPKR